MPGFDSTCTPAWPRTRSCAAGWAKPTSSTAPGRWPARRCAPIWPSAAPPAARELTRAEAGPNLDELELGVEHPGRGQLHVDPLGDRPERGRAFAVGIGGHDRATLVAALAQRRQQGYLTQERDLEPVGQLLAPTGAE